MKNPQKQSQPPLECFKGRGTACGGGDKDKTEYNYAEKTAMTYVYDSNGNIVSKTPYTNVTSSDLSAATQGTSIVYGYGDSNWSDKLTSYDGQTISYDESGNPTSYKGDNITWNGRLMTSYTKGERRYEFAYNSDGMRTVKRAYENGELVYTYTYIWDGDVLLGGRMEDDEGVKTTVRYLYDDSGELYGMDYNGKGYFAFIKNLQGDIVSIVPLDSENDSKVNIEYDAWGKPIIGQTSSAQEKLLLIMMMAVTNVAYRSYFYDFDTGLYYLRSRYYDPETGRFVNADDTAYLGYDASPLSMNLFAYCENNPVNGSDHSGKYYFGSLAYSLAVGYRIAYKNSLCAQLFTYGLVKSPAAFSNNFISLLRYRLTHSTGIQDKLNFLINKIQRRSQNKGNETFVINFYDYKKNISDVDLFLSIGGGGKINFQIEYLHKKNSKGNKIYKVKLIMKNDSFDFNDYWDKKTRHDNNAIITVLNNIGYRLQKNRVFRKFLWSFQITFEGSFVSLKK